MPLTRAFGQVHRHTARLPRLVTYMLAALFVEIAMAVNWLASLLDWPSPIGFLFLVYAILAAAALNRGSGYVATLLAALASLPFVPTGAGGWIRPDWILPFTVFITLGLGISALVESMTHALRDREAALVEVQAAMRRRALLLVEYRHRTRGDLQAVSSLLRLRMRHVADPEAKQALAEAAGHTVSLGRIHTRLERAEHDADEMAMVDAGVFIRGVCADMVPPVADAWGVPRWISTDRAVALGLVMVEIIAEARRDGAGVVAVRLLARRDDFILDVLDDRPAVGPTDGMRQRLIGLLAAQLRGTVTRAPNVAGPGWAVSLRFPLAAPALAPAKVGAGTTT